MAYMMRSIDVREFGAADFGRYRCVLNGMDISGDVVRAEEFSDGSVRALCHVKDEAGQIRIDPHAKSETVKEWRVGPGHIVDLGENRSAPEPQKI